MNSLVHRAYLDSEPGVPTDLVGAGSSLENPYVYDDAARELKRMADRGLVKIVEQRERTGAFGSLINKVRFVKIR